MPLYIPLPRHPVTREKVSTLRRNSKGDVLKQFIVFEAIRACSRQPGARRVDDRPPKDTVDHSSGTRPFPGRRRPYCLYPLFHPRRHGVYAPESDGKPRVRFCKPR